MKLLLLGHLKRIHMAANSSWFFHRIKQSHSAYTVQRITITSWGSTIHSKSSSAKGGVIYTCFETHDLFYWPLLAFSLECHPHEPSFDDTLTSNPAWRTLGHRVTHSTTLLYRLWYGKLIRDGGTIQHSIIKTKPLALIFFTRIIRLEKQLTLRQMIHVPNIS